MNLKNMNVTELSQNEVKDVKGGWLGTILGVLGTAIRAHYVGSTGYSVCKTYANQRNASLSEIDRQMQGLW